MNYGAVYLKVQTLLKSRLHVKCNVKTGEGDTRENHFIKSTRKNQLILLKHYRNNIICFFFMVINLDLHGLYSIRNKNSALI